MELVSKIYLVLVGLMYLGLALWCTFAPATTSQHVGFELKPGSGQSEFLTIYGGLEFGLALIFLLAAYKTDMVSFGVIACTLLHCSLVVFRSAGFMLFSDFAPITYKLAIGEWVIALLGIALTYLHSRT